MDIKGYCRGETAIANKLSLSLSTFLCIAVLLCLVSTGCGGKGSAAGGTEMPGKMVSDGRTSVLSQTTITGAAARVLAGPIGDPQGLDDFANGIEPWGPVVAVHTVTLPNDEVHIVNQLASPDPFTAMYQLEDGTLRTTNEPVELCWDPDYHGGIPNQVSWMNPQSEKVLVYEHIILVWFDQAISEQELVTLIDTYNLHVVMSWFESPDGGGGDAVGGDLQGGSSGNEIAYFEFEYDPLVWSTLDTALAFFEAHPNVDCVMPNSVKEYRATYAPPDDPYYQQQARSTWPETTPSSFGAGFATSLEVDEIPSIENAGYSNQVIAVIDSGVARPYYDETTGILWGHPDFGFWSMLPENPGDPSLFSGKIVRTGVDCWPREYDTSINGGQPMYGDTEHFGSHGTCVAGLLAADTNNSLGIPALAPRAMILPIRGWYVVDSSGAGYLDSASLVKAYRALRMDYSHGLIGGDEQWGFKVRVVNCSYGSPQCGGTYTNINRDLKLNDRLYIASAGNNDATINELVYPAAFEHVLGVTGLTARIVYDSLNQSFFDVDYFEHNYIPGFGSNYYSTSVYPVSGVYEVSMIPAQKDELLSFPGQALSIDINGHPHYQSFYGTSAAAPCVAALAFHLYDIAEQHSSIVNRNIVCNHIINTIDDSTAWFDPPCEIAGVVSYSSALSSWLY